MSQLQQLWGWARTTGADVWNILQQYTTTTSSANHATLPPARPVLSPNSGNTHAWLFLQGDAGVQWRRVLLAAGLLSASGFVWMRLKTAQRRNRANVAASASNSSSSSVASTRQSSGGNNSGKKKAQKRLHRLIGLLLRASQRARVRLLILAGLCIVRTIVSDRLAKLQGGLFSAVFSQDSNVFIQSLVQTMLTDLLYCGIQSSLTYFTDHISLLWRQVLNNQINRYYFNHMTYYKLSFVDKRIAAPEDRLTIDVPKFSKGISETALSVMKGVFDGAYFTYRLGVEVGPGWAAAGWIYVALAVILVQSVAPNYGKLLAQKNELEGVYRRSVNNVSVHSESIAAYDGAKREDEIVQSKFRDLTQHIQRLIFTQWRSGMLEDFMYKYFGATVAAILIIAPFFNQQRRERHTGVTGSTSMILAKMRYVTSLILGQLLAIGSLASVVVRLMRLSGYADRIGELLEVSSELAQAHKQQHSQAVATNNESSDSHTTIQPQSNTSNTSSISTPRGASDTPRGVSRLLKSASASSHIRDGPYIAFDGVEVMTPSGHTLVRDLSFEVRPGTNLLLIGPNGAGKSSLFRCLGALWPVVRGTITKPCGRAHGKSSSSAALPHAPSTVDLDADFNAAANELEEEGLCGDVFYLPQKPYNVIGSLQDQLTYPHKSVQSIPEDQMRELLALVDLSYLADAQREQAVNWEETLSLGETQRLAMARLFYHTPTFAILDECTSAVSSDMEQRLYRLCAERNITCITISHRPALEAYHHVKLALDGKGGYSIEKIERKDGVARFVSKSAVAVETQLVKTITAPPTLHYEQLPSPLVFAPHLKNRSTWKRLRSTIKIIVNSLAQGSTRRVIMVAVVVVLRVMLSNFVAHLNGQSVALLIRNDVSAFKRLIGLSVIQSLASAVLAPSLLYLSRRLALDWRIRLSKHLMNLYFKNRAFYKVLNVHQQVSQPEQRLSDDIDKLCTELADLFPDVVKPIVDIMWFSYVTQQLLGWRNTAMLYMYMVGGLGFLHLITPDFTQLTQKQQEAEAQFRFIHSRLRTHGESVAFFNGDKRERAIADSAFHVVLRHAREVIARSWGFGVVNDFIVKNLPHHVTWILSMVYTKRFFSDRSAAMKSATSANALEGQLGHDLRYVASAVSHTFLAFGELLELYKRYQQMSGYLTRVAELKELLLAIQHQDTIKSKQAKASLVSIDGTPVSDSTTLVSPSTSSAVGQVFDAPSISFQHVDVVTPTGKCLAYGLEIEVKPGEPLLISGPNGSGKTSVFRVLSELWPLREHRGRLGKPLTFQSEQLCRQLSYSHDIQENKEEKQQGHEQQIKQESKSDAHSQFPVFFVPQRPYNVMGTLADLITYPVPATQFLAQPNADAHLRQLLAAVQVPYLLDREGGWNAVANWADVLSLGEQQRLGMARLFFHRPEYAVLDQCTDAISVDVEESLYQYAKKLGITIITISQRPALTHLHTQSLQLTDALGSWTLSNLKPVAK